MMRLSLVDGFTATMSLVATAVRSLVAGLASSVLVVSVVSPSVAQSAVVESDPDLGAVLGAPVSTPAGQALPLVPEGDFSGGVSHGGAKPVGASGWVTRPVDFAALGLLKVLVTLPVRPRTRPVWS